MYTHTYLHLGYSLQRLFDCLVNYPPLCGCMSNGTFITVRGSLWRLCSAIKDSSELWKLWSVKSPQICAVMLAGWRNPFDFDTFDLGQKEYWKSCFLSPHRLYKGKSGVWNVKFIRKRVAHLLQRKKMRPLKSSAAPLLGAHTVDILIIHHPIQLAFLPFELAHIFLHLALCLH